MVKKKDPGANRAHRERGQVLSRGRLGLLEKHKDYVHRARDYKSKQDRIRKLREKAAFKNKDEFYWGMVKGQTKGGVAIGDRGNEALSADTVKLLKTQDARYVRLQIAKDQKKVNKLRAELESLLPPSDPEAEWDAVRELKEVEQLAEMGIVVTPRGEIMQSQARRKRKSAVKEHTIFAEDKDSFDATSANRFASSSKVTLDGTSTSAVAEDLGWDDVEIPPRAGSAKNVEDAEEVDEEEQAEELQARRMTLYSLLSAHLARIRELRIAETKLSTQIGLFGKGSAQKVQKSGWVEDETAPEDRNGDRKTLQRNVFKYKLPRRT